MTIKRHNNKKKQGKTKIKINQLIEGKNRLLKRKNIRKQLHGLKKIVNSYHKRNLNEYLIGIAHNLQI